MGLRAAGPLTLYALVALVLTLATVATSTSAFAVTRTRTVTYTGSILLAHGPYNAVTATGAPCDPKSPVNGVDGVWYKVPPGATRVRFAPSALLDSDLLFRTAACRSIIGGGFLGGQGYGHVVSGAVPKGASFVLVNGWLGTGSFILKLSG